MESVKSVEPVKSTEPITEPEIATQLLGRAGPVHATWKTSIAGKGWPSGKSGSWGRPPIHPKSGTSGDWAVQGIV